MGVTYLSIASGGMVLELLVTSIAEGASDSPQGSQWLTILQWLRLGGRC